MTRPIISPARLKTMSDRVVLLDARPRAEYEQRHLRGAIHADLETHLSTASDPGANPAKNGRHPLPPVERWLEQLGAWGIGPETPVAIYDDQSGANAAARAWWMLRAIGHEDVAVIDGGMNAAIEEGFDVTTDVPHPEKRPAYPGSEWTRPIVDMDEVERLRRDPAWRVVDVRSAERFRGDTEPFDPVAGHIPGAINVPYSENLEGGRFKKPAQLREKYEQILADIPPERVVVHCGSGVTACHTLLALEAAGLTGSSLYIGSWSEWCRNDTPRAMGD